MPALSQQRKIKPLQVLKSVLGAFIGVQSEEVRTRDFSSSSALPFIITGLALAAVLVGGLILFVRAIA